jgi:hypothetical protein
MSRHCERPGCSKVGEVIYEVDLRRLVVTIDFPDLNDASPVNLLCRRHADSLTVPKGWTIINNREEVQRLFSAPITQEVSKNNSRKVVRRQSVSDFNDDEMNPVTVANLFDLIIDDHLFATADHATVDAGVNITTEITTDITAELAQLMDTQETQGLPWTPRFDRSGDLDGKLRARGRLLGRAFGNTESSNDDENYQDSQCDRDHDQSNLES